MKGNFVQELFKISVMKTIWKLKKQFLEIQDRYQAPIGV